MVLKLQPEDNIIIALESLEKGKEVIWDGRSYILQEYIPVKHKFAAQNFNIGDQLIMYGVVVGKATRYIAKGALISTENVVHYSEGFSSKKGKYEWQPLNISRWKNRTFMGYHRADGKVGTANHWLFVPLVFCQNRNIGVIQDVLNNALGYSKPSSYKSLIINLVKEYQQGESISGTPQSVQSISEHRVFKNIDGIKFLNHQGGCGGTRDDARALCQLLAGYIAHPNVAGATVLSLGCQHAEVSWLNEAIEAIAPKLDKPVLVYEQQQESSSEEHFLSKVISETFEALIEANNISRKPAPLSKLCIGVECGSSDGLSGITANPAIGYAADMIVSLGGSVILSEFPELCGVEQELINRCVSDEKAAKFIKLQRTYAARAESVGSGFDMNPSPGNIRDGLITDAMKSAGAAKKGGSAYVADVLDYTEQVTEPGLNLLCTPGNDVESTTAMAGSGANLILFSTGLGTPTGNPIAPVVKVSSNTALAEKLPYMIDIDAGKMLTEHKSLEDMGEEILEFCIKVASGEVQTKAQQLMQDDFIPWKRGVSL